MKRYAISMLAIIFALDAAAQQALDFFPSQNGYQWYYETVVLDSFQNVVPNSQVARTDSLAGDAVYQGRSAKIILSGLGDSAFVSFDGANAAQYIGVDLPLDSSFAAIGDSLRALFGWYPTYQFARPVNQSYTLISRSFNAPIDSTTTLPLLITVSGRRLSDQTVTVPFGTFQNAKRFLITTQISSQILPPPFPPLPLFALTDTSWVATNTWIVKRVTPSTNVNLSSLGIPTFTIPGQRTELAVAPALSHSEPPKEPQSFRLQQNYPNPFNPTTVIRYQLSSASDVRLELFDVLGRKVATLVDARENAGSYAYTLNASAWNLASGAYFYRLQTGKSADVRKMILAK
jgi:hypothetical protein